MSSAEPAARKKRTTEGAKRTAEDDHRRKRRNRTTQSCLNCHTSKRMCDRKRPCGRCTQLGLTGLCVYEVDDPNQRTDSSDEKTRLQNRVAELESVIRELKNKPHPRWVQTLDRAKLQLNTEAGSNPSSPPRSCSEESEASSSSSPRIHLHPPTPSPSARASPQLSSRVAPLHIASSSAASSSSSSIGSPSPVDPPSPLGLSPGDATGDSGYDFTSLLSSVYTDGTGMDNNFDNILEGLIRQDQLALSNPDPCHIHHERGHCGCLSDATSYSVVLELSLRLRRAAEVLSRDAKHRTASMCSLHQRITDLDRRASEALANVNTTTPTFTSYAPPHHSTFATPLQNPSGRAANIGATISPHSLHGGVRPWDFKASASYPSPPCEDTFMSWDPSRRSSEWVATSGL
ncbi:hypothetical protein BDW22DRAFT_1429612 [Trametopsis cervina]|nr:hypothetical protein BDW22DRAFT_1429612 [Trametopsis cervina]